MAKISIQSFEKFINENYVDPDQASDFQRFYMLVKKPFPLTSDNDLGRMIGSTRNELFDQVTVDNFNYDHLEFKSGVPILNFTEDNEIVKKMLDKKIISKSSLYNNPDSSSLVSDKVIFHKTFKDQNFVPKTVFSVEDAAKLKFPVIAKPANGKSAEGIKKFDTPEDLKKSSDKFDTFSEAIDIKKEFRCFCFRDKIIELDERIKVDGAKDFLKDTKTTTDFYYKEITHGSYSRKQELDKILSASRKLVDLDFFSLDFAETPSGELFLIEMNSRTGMGVDKMVELYTLIYKDFYDRNPGKDSSEKMKDLVKSWEETYDKEKASKVNECTALAGKLDGVTFLFKNRDRSYTPESVVVHEKIEGVEVVYYTDQTGWIEGMNENGIGFVFTQLTTKEWKGYTNSYHVTDDPKDDSLFKPFEKGIKKVLSSKTLEDAIDALLKSKKSGSFLIGDSKNIYEIEVVGEKHKKRKLSFTDTPYYAKTNHGELFPDAGHQSSGESIKRASTSIRRHQALQQLQGIQTVGEIPTRMKFQAFDSGSSLNVFRTDNEEYTISQCLMDLSNLSFYFFNDPLTGDSLKIKDDVKNPKIQVHASTI